MKSDPQHITFHYTFAFEGSEAKTFDIVFRADTLSIILDQKADVPEWTRLSFSKCPNCPLDEKCHSVCPAAISLVDIINIFQSSLSYEHATVTIESEESLNALTNLDAYTQIMTFVEKEDEILSLIKRSFADYLKSDSDETVQSL